MNLVDTPRASRLAFDRNPLEKLTMADAPDAPRRYASVMRQCFPPLSATAPDTRERAETASGQKKNTALAAGLFVLAGLLVNDGSPASQRLAEVSSRLMLNHFAVELVLLVLGLLLLPLGVLGVSLCTCLVTLFHHFIAPGAI